MPVDRLVEFIENTLLDSRIGGRERERENAKKYILKFSIRSGSDFMM